ncbi:MAG TPA: hypothetical protein VGH74_17350 [Planctomycetaceae bacterium]|jgi:hypothetical protein
MSMLHQAFEIKRAQDVPEPIRARYEKLKKEWQADTRFVSSTTEIAMHLSYQKIIGMGPAVVPLILQDLSREADHWFWALMSITDSNPVNPQNAGVPSAMARDWLSWGAKNGYFWEPCSRNES